MSETDKGIIVTTIENSPGRVTIAMYERHQPDEPGLVMRKELDLHEMAHMSEVLFRAMWCHVRNLI